MQRVKQQGRGKKNGGGAETGFQSFTVYWYCSSAVKCQVKAPLSVPRSLFTSWSAAELIGLLSDGRIDAGCMVGT